MTVLEFWPGDGNRFHSGRAHPVAIPAGFGSMGMPGWIHKDERNALESQEMLCVDPGWLWNSWEEQEAEPEVCCVSMVPCAWIARIPSNP